MCNVCRLINGNDTWPGISIRLRTQLVYLYFHFKSFALHCLHFVIIVVLSVFQCKKMLSFHNINILYFILFVVVDIVFSFRCKEVCFSSDFDRYTCYFANICIILVYDLHLDKCLQTKALQSSWCWYILQSRSFFSVQIYHALTCIVCFWVFLGRFFVIIRFLVNIFASIYSINTGFFLNIKFNDIFS